MAGFIYVADYKMKLICGMLDGLAFLPVSDVPEDIQYLKKKNIHLKTLNLLVFTSTQRMSLEHIAEYRWCDHPS